MTSRRVDPKTLGVETALAQVLRAHGTSERTAVSVEHDDRVLDGRLGESLAVTLLAHDAHTLARSVKFHRPRGPMCLRGACDGCLTRIDGVPNVMACRVPARDGARVVSQNAFPNAGLDVLRVTDWFFPKQFDHHHLMVAYGTTVNRTMQVFARRMAGLGTLPDVVRETPDAEQIACHVLVVGAGAAGLATATALARDGFDVLVVEEEPNVGGMLRDEFAPLTTTRGAAITGVAFVAALAEEAVRAGVKIRTGASAAATFDNATVALTDERALWITARARVFANGVHETVGSFDNNDLPGVYTARAAARALTHGVTVGDHVVLVGDAWPAEGLARALLDAASEVTWLRDATVVRAEGRGRVRGAVIQEGLETVRRRCDALVVALRGTPAYELLGQAGVALHADPETTCFVPHANGEGHTSRDDVFAVGAVRQHATPFHAVDLEQPLNTLGVIAEGMRVAQRVALALRGGGHP